MTDAENRLVGIVTFDDAIDVIREEATEDIEKMAAITPTDKPYLKTGVFETFGKRIPWLCLLMISATFTGSIIAHFEDALAKAVSSRRSSRCCGHGRQRGSQASVTVIRGLSLGELSMRDIFRILWKELRVALLCGAALAALGFAKLLLFDRVSLRVALVVCLTLAVTVLVAKLVGASLPILAKRLGFDPAVMASPFITTIVDALSLLFFFNIASMLIPELRI